MGNIFVAGSGFHLPEERITNADLISKVATTEEWIDTRVGIVERRRAPDSDNTSDLGAYATEAALERTGWSREEIDLLVCATSTPNCLIPATASYICERMKIDSVAFDLNAACSGFTYGLSVAGAMLNVGRYDRMALVTAEKYTRVTDYTDRATCVLKFQEGLCQAGELVGWCR